MDNTYIQCPTCEGRGEIPSPDKALEQMVLQELPLSIGSMQKLFCMSGSKAKLIRESLVKQGLVTVVKHGGTKGRARLVLYRKLD